MESKTSELSDIKTTVDLDKFIESFSIDENGFAVYLCNKYNINDVSFALDTIFLQHISGYVSNKGAIYNKLKKMITKMIKYRKNVSRDLCWKKIEILLTEPLKVPIPKLKAQPSTRLVSTVDEKWERATQEEVPPPAKKLRLDCEQCLSVRKELQSICQTLKEKKILVTDVKTKADLEQLIETFSEDENTGTLRNGFVVYLCKKYNLKDATSVLNTIFMQCDSSYSSNEVAVRKVLSDINIKMTTFKKNLKRFWPKIEEFLIKPVRFPRRKPKAQLSTSTVDTAVDTTVDMLEGAPQAVVPPPTMQLRGDCEQCASVREECRAKCRALKNNLKEKRQMICALRKLYNVKNVNKQRKRLYERIAKLKVKLSDLKKNVANQGAVKTQKRKKVPKSLKLTIQLSKPTNKLQTMQISKPTNEVQTIQISKHTNDPLGLTGTSLSNEFQAYQISKPTYEAQAIQSSKPTNEAQTIQSSKPTFEAETKSSKPTGEMQT